MLLGRWRELAEEITLLIDSKTKYMYTLFKLSSLHEAQCVKYAFPDPAKNSRHAVV